LITWFQSETNWHFVLSTSKVRLFKKEGFPQACQEYPLQKGKKKLLKNIKLKHEKCQRMNLLLWWGKKYDKPLYLLTFLTKINEITSSYRKRFLIETMLCDVKSKGFFLSKSRVQKTDRMSRLILAVAFAYIWTLDLGVRVLRIEQWEKIARNKRIDKSLFRLGLDWFTYLLKNGKPIPISFQVAGIYGDLK